MKNKTVLFWLLFIFGSVFLFLFTFSFVLVLLGHDKLSLTSNGNIGVVEVKGVIMDPKIVLEQLETFAEDDNIKGIILRVDSPGGSVGPSQEIYEQVLEVRKKKKVVASMVSVAASGGYYVACSADKIVANAGTLTGSIGVIMEMVNLEELYRWAKLKPQTIKSGRYKDIGSSTRDMTPEERKLLEDLLQDTHERFKADILRGRPNLTPEKLATIADGRVLSGSMAKELGLIDELGNLYAAVDLLVELTGLQDEPELVYPKEDEPSLFDLMVNGSVEDLAQRLQGFRGRLTAPLLLLMGE